MTPKLNTDVRVRVSEEQRHQIEELVDERSQPGERITVSDVVRDAIDEYLDEYHEQ